MAITKFQQIGKIVEEFQQEADGLFSEYGRKLDRARGRYNEETFKEKSWEIWSEVGGRLDVKRNIAKNEIDLTLEEVKKDFDKWVVAPVNGNLLQTLNCVRNFEIPLGMEELRILEKSVSNSFFAKKIFTEIARENGYYLKSPNAQEYMNLLQRVQNNACNAVTSYAGHYPDFIGKDLLPEWEHGGEMPSYLFVAAGRFLQKDTSLKQADELWGASEIPTAYKLTDAEQKRIYDLVGSIESETEKQARIKQLTDAEPDFLDKLKLMGGEYGEAVTKYLNTGSLDYVHEDNSEANIKGYGA